MQRQTRLTAVFSCLFPAVLLLLAGCGAAGSSDNKSVSDTGFYFDTVVSITLNGTEDSSLLESCFSMMADYEAMLSRTREGSDVWNINHSAGKPVQVSGETASLIRTALSYSELSGGAFDITIAPAAALWDFQGEGARPLPAASELEEALSHVDYRNVEVEGSRVTLNDPEASIDLGGIAKGYIADQLKTFLKESGITSGLIDLGGNILAIGGKGDGSPWKIGIRKPFGETASELSAAVTVRDQSVVTSGTYERWFEKDGRLYHHILDTKTGFPAETGLKSVSILSPSSVDGDALSTTCFLLGPDRGMELIETLDGIEALFITDNDELLRSSGFPEE